MQSQKMNIYILCIGLLLIVYSCYEKYVDISILPNIPVVVVPDVPLPLDKNIYYDEYEKCKDLSKEYNKKLVLVFGADWCPYCRDLKKDVNSITEFSNYIVCFIDTDKNKTLVDQYRIKGLPTSIIITHKEEELDRKSGYKRSSYNEWLKNSKQDNLMSWIDLN